MEDNNTYVVLVDKGDGEQTFTIELNLKTAIRIQEDHIRSGFTAVVMKFNALYI